MAALLNALQKEVGYRVGIGGEKVRRVVLGTVCEGKACARAVLYV